MIAALHGEVLSTGAGWVVVQTGGVGFRVEVPTSVAASTHSGATVSLHTQMIVREDAITLFGFTDTEALATFNLLVSVNGVGPRSALGILSQLTPVEIARAVQAEDAKPFKAVSGIGPKTAGLILVSLNGKLDHLALGSGAEEAGADPHLAAADSADAVQVLAALTGLGWSEREAAAAVQDAQAAGAETEASALLRAALRILQVR